ncbi:MAG: endonuclease MutS2 [Eubacteriales bacterium]
MSDFQKARKSLEYDKILEMLADCARTAGAKELALAASPDDDEVRIARLQAETSDAKFLAAQNGTPPFGSAPDVTGSVDRAEKGAMLSPPELLDIADLLSSISSMISYAGIRGAKLGSLEEIFGRLVQNPALEREIRRCILSADMIADDASPKLAEIRRSIRITNNRIRDTLQRYITAESTTKYLQENLVTIREGRYVIPVKAEHKGEIKGLVHDTSSTGATLFIEPLAVVEANNTLRELEVAEKKEIERILYDLSAKCADFGHCIRLNYHNLTALAYIFARAELSFRMRANPPALSNDGEIFIHAARHPLIVGKKPVPVDIRLGGDFDTLIITGPNTGGKTVSLKTLGLLTLMAQTGLHIPAEEDSKLRIFSKVLADIGDEQSIEQSLSTFSAHMTNIVRILGQADDHSLVLFDELGAGTDPIEGAALAVAITQEVRNSGALLAVTTHYSEMKVYALETEGVCNGACEFDVTTLAPTYRLIIGAPGKSNAFAISERLGLDPAIIRRANTLIDPANKKFENVIEKLEQTRIETERTLAEAQQMRADYEKKKAEGEAYIKKQIAEADRIKETSSEQATRIIESARATSDYVMAELEKVRKAKESADFSKTMDEARQNMRKAIKEGESKSNPVVSHAPEDYKLPRPVVKGDDVMIISLGVKGVVQSPADKNGNVTVHAGIMTTKVQESNLMLIEEPKAFFTDKNNRRRPAAKIGQSVTQSFSPEIDLRGMTGEEAWTEVDKYLDSAQIAGVPSVRLIHGKGTGALKKYLWQFLKGDKRIKSYRIGSYGEGDLGVTVVELK